MPHKPGSLRLHIVERGPGAPEFRGLRVDRVGGVDEIVNVSELRAAGAGYYGSLAAF